MFALMMLLLVIELALRFSLPLFAEEDEVGDEACCLILRLMMLLLLFILLLELLLRLLFVVVDDSRLSLRLAADEFGDVDFDLLSYDSLGDVGRPEDGSA